MLLAVLISSYGCTWEVWRALKKLDLHSAIASSNSYGGGHWGGLNTATPQKNFAEHHITARKVGGSPSPQYLFSV